MLQEVAALLFLYLIGLQCKVLCFLTPGSHPDASYLSFTYDATNFTPKHHYDYIIIGGGTAGCPLAATLSENYSVLLLERGSVPDSDPNISNETNIVTNLINANDHNSSAQSFTSEDGIPNNRGNVLGGSSMVNFGYYSRAEDYFYNKSGIKWDMENVSKAYEWVEDSVVSMPTSLNFWQNSTFHALLESGVGPEHGFTVHHLQGTKISGSTFDGSRRRHGAVELLNKANPDNLRVVVNATVDRVIFSTFDNLSGVVAVGVVYHDLNKKSHEVHLRENGEVILSAGVIGSPQILLLSGIGQMSHLSSHNISVVLQHPSVGQFVVDKPRTGFSLLVPFSLDDIGSQVVGIINGGPYIQSASGVTPFDSPVNSIFFPEPYPPLNLSVVSIVAQITRPLSVGSLSLKSPYDVTITPKVQFNYYNSSEDLHQCAHAVNAIGKMLRTQAMETYKFSNRDGSKYFKFVGISLPENRSNADLIATFCHKTLRTYWHYYGGCLVNKVVDSDLKVIGVHALRVIDSSVLNDSPGTNPQATVMMLGRYFGLKIANAR